MTTLSPLFLLIGITAAVFNLSPICFVCAKPYTLLMNSVPKCISVEGPRDTTVLIYYHYPDFADLDKRAKPNLVISQQSPSLTNGNRRDMVKSNTARHDLMGPEGKINYVTQDDCRVRVCARALTASPQAPKRMHLRIEFQAEGEEGYDNSKSQKLLEEEAAKKQAEDMKAHMSIQRNLNSLEGTLHALITKADLMLRNADYAKEQEVIFHDKSIAMNKASIWWPIVQLLVLLVTGFTQANHMVGFFKRHHIF